MIVGVLWAGGWILLAVHILLYSYGCVNVLGRGVVFGGVVAVVVG